MNVMDASFDINEIKEGLDKLFPGYHIDLEYIFSMIMQGNVWGALKSLLEQVMNGISGEFMGMKGLLISILILGIFSALFSGFSDVFSGQQVAQVGFYFVYLFLMAILTRAFLYAADITVTAIENIIMFVKLLIPTYFVAVGAAVGVTTAAVNYQFFLVIVYFVQSFLLSALLPFIYCYVILALINGIWTEERLTLLLDLMKKGIAFALKLSLGVITGISFIQSIITPAVDNIKTSAFQKAVSIIPGLGNLAGGVTEMVIGSAVLLKNSIGVLLLLLLVFVCAVPLLKLAFVAGIIKVSAAFTGMICDKRIAHCTDRVGDAGIMLLRAAFTAIALFFILIAISAFTIR